MRVCGVFLWIGSPHAGPLVRLPAGVHSVKAAAVALAAPPCPPPAAPPNPPPGTLLVLFF